MSKNNPSKPALEYAGREWKKLPAPIMDPLGITSITGIMPFGQGKGTLTEEDKKILMDKRFDIIKSFKERGLDLSRTSMDFTNSALYKDLVNADRATSLGFRVGITYNGSIDQVSLQNAITGFARKNEGIANREEELKGLFGGKKHRKTKKSKKSNRRNKTRKY
jgi:hypothetical protein